VSAGEAGGAPAAGETWPCGWLVHRGHDEDGTPVVDECGGEAREVGEGWACEAGHEHLGLEAELGPMRREWEREQAELAGR
jgi:hypothetical protein